MIQCSLFLNRLAFSVHTHGLKLSYQSKNLILEDFKVTHFSITILPRFRKYSPQLTNQSNCCRLTIEKKNSSLFVCWQYNALLVAFVHTRTNCTQEDDSKIPKQRTTTYVSPPVIKQSTPLFSAGCEEQGKNKYLFIHYYRSIHKYRLLLYFCVSARTVPSNESFMKGVRIFDISNHSLEYKLRQIVLLNKKA